MLSRVPPPAPSLSDATLVIDTPPALAQWQLPVNPAGLDQMTDMMVSVQSLVAATFVLQVNAAQPPIEGLGVWVTPEP